ncbi:MAG: hypothetical protein NQU41_06255 [Candidatus Methanosuratincola sp.]|jgi:hypothetical protein|nr:hypothetical protein [Candidatus Methanosuratincola sp.]RWX74239.1 MAG: hypothetical protein Metus_0264 [Candidatus Methanosuratincola subterraneus]
MRSATRILSESAADAGAAVGEVAFGLRSLRALVGEPGKRRSLGNLKKVGTALLLTPTPEPFSDIAGLALIGIGALAERWGCPMTVSEMSKEAGAVFRSILQPPGPW